MYARNEDAFDAPRSPSRETVDQPADLYRLKYWVVPRRGMPISVLCALATMTRRSVSRQWLMTEAGLGPDGVDLLLAELEDRGALQTGGADATEGLTRIPSAFLSRLKRWLRGGRADPSSLSIAK